MKAKIWFGLIAAMVMPLVVTRAQAPNDPTSLSASVTAPAVSPSTAEVIKMAEAGTSDEVLLAYVQNSVAPFELSADDILYLRDIGLSSQVIAGMLDRDAAPKSQYPSYDQPLEQPVPQPLADTVPASEVVSAAAPAVVETPAPVYVSSPPAEASYFYDALSPYGSWVQLDGAGWCWQPQAVVLNPGWRPYCDAGHWVYTDAGWFWQSDYSWGWAPFHYGRWFLHDRCGWVWQPDRVWGPAWVSWRHQGEYCGWAPLPPHADFDLHLGLCFNGVHVGANFDFGLRPEHFTFVALSDFHNHDFAHHHLPRSEVTHIYNRTTVMNNYVVNHNTIVNQGIRPERVAAATHTQVRQLALRDVPTRYAAAGNPHSDSRAEVAVYRPQLRATARSVNMIAQRVDKEHPVIQHVPFVTRNAQPGLRGSSAGVHPIPAAGQRSLDTTRSGLMPTQGSAAIPGSRTAAGVRGQEQRVTSTTGLTSNDGHAQHQRSGAWQSDSSTRATLSNPRPTSSLPRTEVAAVNHSSSQTLPPVIRSADASQNRAGRQNPRNPDGIYQPNSPGLNSQAYVPSPYRATSVQPHQTLPQRSASVSTPYHAPQAQWSSSSPRVNNRQVPMASQPQSYSTSPTRPYQTQPPRSASISTLYHPPQPQWSVSSSRSGSGQVPVAAQHQSYSHGYQSAPTAHGYSGFSVQAERPGNQSRPAAPAVRTAPQLSSNWRPGNAPAVTRPAPAGPQYFASHSFGSGSAAAHATAPSARSQMNSSTTAHQDQHGKARRGY